MPVPSLPREVSMSDVGIDLILLVLLLLLFRTKVGI
jgi:hypothetical protein